MPNCISILDTMFCSVNPTTIITVASVPPYDHDQITLTIMPHFRCWARFTLYITLLYTINHCALLCTSLCLHYISLCCTPYITVFHNQLNSTSMFYIIHFLYTLCLCASYSQLLYFTLYTSQSVLYTIHHCALFNTHL